MAYADKRAAQRLAPMRARFADWRAPLRRRPRAGTARNGAWPGSARSASRRTSAGRPGSSRPTVRRLAWTGRAIAAARAAVTRALALRDRAPVGYYFGIDDVPARRGGRRARRERVARGRWRAARDAGSRRTASDASIAAITERVATGSMFGGGTLAVVVEPVPLLRAEGQPGRPVRDPAGWWRPAMPSPSSIRSTTCRPIAGRSMPAGRRCARRSSRPVARSARSRP